MVLPIFVLCMAVCMQFILVMETAGRFGSALCETAEEMAVNAYVSGEEENPEQETEIQTEARTTETTAGDGSGGLQSRDRGVGVDPALTGDRS